MRRKVTAYLTIAAVLGLTLLTPFRAAASTDYNPPADKWNGYKVYLSPSNQSGNVGCFDYVEKDGARAIALRVKDYLVSYGYKVRIGSGDYKANTTDSNNWGSDVHIPIHSNAGIWDCDGIDSSNGGTWLGYGESDDEEIAAEIFYQMAYDSPGTDDRLDEDINLDGSSTWYELRATRMPAAYVEAAFHTYGPDTIWLEEVEEVALGIARGIDNYFGNPRCPDGPNPCPTRAVGEPLPESTPVTPEIAKPALPNTGEPFPELEQALTQLFDGTTFGDKTKGLLKKVMIADGTAIVDLGDLPERLPEVSAPAARAAFFKPVNSIVFSFPNVKAVVYQVYGSSEAFADWIGSTGDPLTREQWERVQARGQ